MSDQLSKVVAEMREMVAMAANAGTNRVGTAVRDWADRIESAAAPVEVGGVEGYATGMEARDMHAEANLLRTLARQLSDSEASRREAEASLAEAKAEIERLCEIEAAAVKVEEDANAFAADLERWAHDPLVGLTPMRLGDVKRHASQIRAIACNLAGARHSNREQAESALAAATRRVAEVEDDAARWRFCTSEHELGDGQVAKMHINVGVNVWRGEKWLGFHECSPDEARAAIDDVLQKEPK